MTTAFHYTFPVPFHLADPAGIVFFANAFTLFHQAFEQFIVKELDYPWENWFQNPEWIVPVRHAEAQYVYPLYAGRDCQIELTLASLSSSSFTLLVNIRLKELCSTLKVVHVFCNRSTQKKMPIPQPISSKLKFFTLSVLHV